MGGHSLSPYLPATKTRITALHYHDDRLYIGTADGALSVYTSSTPPALRKTYQLLKRPIDQLGVLAESKKLVVLSDSAVALYALDDPAAKPAPLPQARTAHAFASTTYFQSGAGGKAARDLLVIGCRKKVVVIGAGKGFDAWELALPHSPRHVIFPSPTYAALPDSVHLLFTPTTAAILHIHPTSPAAQRLAVTDLSAAAPPPAKGEAAPATEAAGSGLSLGVGAFTGLGGYVLGKGANAPVGVRTVGGEIVLARDDVGVFYSSEGHYTRNESLQYPATPDAIAFANPYLYSMVTTVQANAQPALSVQIHLTPTLSMRETIAIPQPATGHLLARLAVLTTPGGPVLIATTPSDKAMLTAEGSSIWALSPPTLEAAVGELISEGRIGDAIGLVEAVGDASLPHTQQLPHLRILHALARFAKAEYAAAFETFTTSAVNPALVVALYPAHTIAGALHIPRERWMMLFGAPEGRLEPVPNEGTPEDAKEGGLVKGALKLPHLLPTKRTSLDTVRTGGSEDTDEEADGKLPREAIQELMFFLSDRRQKLTGAMATLSTPLPAEEDLPPLSSLPPEETHALPSVPFAELSPEQLLRTAQVVYTTLLKVYLVARPTLVGSLCRIENWCDVVEVEGLLRAQGRFDDLRDLYMQKKMHAKALSMLHELAQSENDPLDRYPPTIRYLQKLGPGHLPLIFEWSGWILKEDPSRALQIFTADEPEVDALPRAKIVEFLDRANEGACVGYLEHLTRDLNDQDAVFHEKLAELYLARARKNGNADELVAFLNASNSYRAHRLLNKLGPDEVPAARAVLLGRMGKHEEALTIYVRRLEDYAAAEAYCARAYARPADAGGIFLVLLRLYLTPPAPHAHAPLLAPALALIATHSTRLDAQAVLALLPPLVTVHDVATFVTRTLREGSRRRNEGRILKQLAGARQDEVERVLMGLEVRRVRVTDQRICPQCHKRIGQSAIAVHAPRGEVTHLHCKDPFSATLARQRE
ncbi:Vacuolar morphogenesis protein 6 [Cryptotrichosporon argae]